MISLSHGSFALSDLQLLSHELESLRDLVSDVAACTATADSNYVSLKAFVDVEASFEPKKDSLGVLTTELTAELNLKLMALQSLKLSWRLSVRVRRFMWLSERQVFEADVNLIKLLAQMQTLLLAQQSECMLIAQVEIDIKARKPLTLPNID